MSNPILLTFFSLLLLTPIFGISEEAEKGQVTNLPIPRYVSIKAKEANVRRGPSLSHKIDWVYKRKNMPLEIYAEYENIISHETAINIKIEMVIALNLLNDINT